MVNNHETIIFSFHPIKSFNFGYKLGKFVGE